MNPKQFGNRLRLAREQRGMSQEDLAYAVKKNQGAISEYENGVRKIYVTDLPKFADALDVPILYFFDDILTETDFHRALIQEFEKLPSNEWKQTVIEIVRNISETAAL